jgi:tetratricopeptide (TPR) repeat protein
MDTRLNEQLDDAARELEHGGFHQTLRILEETEVESLLTTDFWYLRGFAQRGLGDYAEAADSFATVVTVKPGEVAAHALAAESFVRCQRLGAAEQHLLRGLAASPKSTDLLEVYCSACARGGQTEKARALLQRLLECDPDNEAAFRLRILIEFVEGSDEGLYQATRQYLDELADTPENALATGKAMLDGGRISGALRCFSEALRQDPGLRERHPDFFREIGVLESPFLLPSRLLDRYGRWLPWAVGAVTVLALQSLHLAAGAIFAAGFALFLLYSWVAPPLVRRLRLGHW